MNFRFRAFAWHLLGSAAVMALVLGALYLGWYRWPGWYLTGSLRIALIMAAIDVVLGPLLTLVIADPNKARRQLARDIAVIICVQLIAASYGASTLWRGRILYYTYSSKWLEVVQANDLSQKQIELGQQINPQLAPHWYSLPRWVYAALPDDPQLADKIKSGVVLHGGEDIIQMPQYFRPWQAGATELQKDLHPVDQLPGFAPSEIKRLKESMQERGIALETAQAITVMGREARLAAVVDPKSLELLAILRAD